MIVYLAGPIQNISPEDATKWRKQAKEYLEKMGIGCLDPTLGKDLTKREYNLSEIKRDIIKTDKRNILKSDMVLADISRDCIMNGTAMEIMFAYMNHIPVVAWGTKNAKDPWIIGHIAQIFPFLCIALDYIKSRDAKEWRKEG